MEGSHPPLTLAILYTPPSTSPSALFPRLTPRDCVCGAVFRLEAGERGAELGPSLHSQFLRNSPESCSKFGFGLPFLPGHEYAFDAFLAMEPLDSTPEAGLMPHLTPIPLSLDGPACGG